MVIERLEGNLSLPFDSDGNKPFSTAPSILTRTGFRTDLLYDFSISALDMAQFAKRDLNKLLGEIVVLFSPHTEATASLKNPREGFIVGTIGVTHVKVRSAFYSRCKSVS